MDRVPGFYPVGWGFESLRARMLKENTESNVYFVVPCYNEASRWNFDYWKTLFSIPRIFWLFVNDGSTDKTGDILNKYADLKNVEILTLHKNVGKSAAVRSGANYIFEHHLEGKYIGFLDADGAFSPVDINRFTNEDLLVKLNELDAIWSSRVKLAGRLIDRNPVRHFLARIISALLSLRFKNMPYDTQSGLKLFTKSSTLLKIFSKEFNTRWLFELEILGRWEQIAGQKINIWEEPVMGWKDVSGSKIRFKELIRIFFEITKVIFTRKF